MNPPCEGRVTGWLLARIAWRHWRFAPGQTALLVLLLALGVAVFLSVRLANRAALAGFGQFASALTGESDLVVTGPAGSRLPAGAAPAIREALDGMNAELVPVIEASGQLPPGPDGSPGTPLRWVGLDIVALANLTGRSGAAPRLLGDSDGDPRAGRERFWETLHDPAAAFLAPALVARLGVAPGDRVAAFAGTRAVTVRVAGLVPPAEGGVRPPENLIVMDLPALRALLGEPARLDRMEVFLPTGARGAALAPEARRRLERDAGGRWEVTTSDSQRETAATMTRAFRLNLTVLSLVALLTGLYLVSQALDGAVVRRRHEIAILRALGTPAAVVRRAWLLESLALGCLGGLAGVALGWAGAQGAVRFVGRTIDTLYFETAAPAAALRLDEAGLAVGLAMLASVAAGWWPARAAARVEPARHASRVQASAHLPRLRRFVIPGLVLMAVGAGLAQLPPWRGGTGTALPLGGYAAAFAWLMGGGLAAGLLVPLLARALGPTASLAVPAALAVAHLRRPTGRHLLAVAGLLVATAMTGGMLVLIASFDLTMRGWIGRTLQADLYLSAQGARAAAPDRSLDTATWRAIAARPEVARAVPRLTVPLTIAGKPAFLIGTDVGFFTAGDDFPWIERPTPGTLPEDAAPALATESFAAHHGVGRGDRLEVLTPTGPRSVHLTGVYADYSNDRGSLLTDFATVARWWGRDDATTLTLELQPGIDAESLRAELQRAHPGLNVFTQGALRAEILRIFGETFALTRALQILGVTVAVLGLALTLTSMLLDRRDELATLRALGTTRRQMAAAAAIEGAATGAAGALGGIAVALGLGWLLIAVVNKQSFGWTLQAAIPAGALAALAAAVVAAGAAASWLVGRWGASLPAEQEEE